MKIETLRTADAVQFNRVLVVEDDEVLRVLLERILRSINPDVEYDWVVTAERGRAELRKAHYDLVIADFTLQGKATGLDLWAFCQDRFPGLPFMMVSGLEIERFIKLVGRAPLRPLFLPKPFRPGECKQLIELLLSYRRIAA